MTRIALIVGAASVALTGILFTALYIKFIQSERRADFAEKELDAVTSDLNRFRETVQKQAESIDLLEESIDLLEKDINHLKQSVEFYEKKSQEIQHTHTESINEINTINSEPGGSDWLNACVPDIVCKHVSKRVRGKSSKNNTKQAADLDNLHEATGYADID